jgi:hypothetical protein
MDNYREGANRIRRSIQTLMILHLLPFIKSLHSMTMKHF